MPPHHPGQRRHAVRNERVGAGPADIRRLARRGGVKRLSGLIDARLMDQILRDGMLTETIGRAVHVADRRKTVSLLDVLYALRVGGRPVWGIGDRLVSDVGPSQRVRGPHGPPGPPGPPGQARALPGPRFQPASTRRCPASPLPDRSWIGSRFDKSRIL